MFDVFVACGGDGTVQLVARELLNSDKVMGILPLGSGNDFSKLLNRSTKISDFIEILKNGSPTYCDLIKVNESQYFINTFGLGFDGDANEIASKVFISVGKLKYFYAALKSLIRISKFQISIQCNEQPGLSYNSFMVVASNGKWEGGSFLISPNSDPTDGEMELTICTSISKWALLAQILRLSMGMPLVNTEFVRISCKSAHLQVNHSLLAHADGEVLETKSDYYFQVIPKSVRILSKSH